MQAPALISPVKPKLINLTFEENSDLICELEILKGLNLDLLKQILTSVLNLQY